MPGSTFSDVCIFIPAYNARNHLEGVIRRIPEAVWPELNSLWIIDDGSEDGTGEVIRELQSRYSIIRTVAFPENRGYGHAVRKGLEAARDEKAACAICLHADGQYAPESIPELLRTMREGGFDILQGSRMAPGTALRGGMPRYKYIAGRVLTAMENRVFGLKLSDYHSGFLCYGKRALALPFHRFSGSFDFDLEMIACGRARGLRIGEIGIPTRYADETSHLSPIPYGFRVLGVLGKYLMGKYGHRVEN